MAIIHQLLYLLVLTFSTPIDSQQCKHPLPILMKTASGVDITKFDFQPINGPSSSNRHDGFVENVFNFTCSFRTWHEYDVPDALKGPIELGDDYMPFIRHSIAFNPFDVKRSNVKFIKQFGVSAEALTKKLFTQNPKYQSLLKQYFDLGNIFGQIFAKEKMQKFELNWSETPLSKDFKDSIKKLPLKYSDNPNIYHQFVQRFGTHFIHYGQFGFVKQLQFAIDQQYAIEHSDEQVMRNLKASFYRAFNESEFYGHKRNETELYVDDDFVKNSKLILSYGGNTSKWVDEMSGETFLAENNSDRVILSIELHDLDQLIANENIGEQVRIAIRMYTIKAYLGELKNVYNFTNYQLSKEDKASLMQVETMIKANDTQNMELAEQIIDHLYNKVSLFTDRKLCLPTLYDLYITANVKLDFAQNVCALTRRCASDTIVSAQKKVNELFNSYENEQCLDCVKNSRKINLEFHILNDRDNGLEVNCTEC